jgi:ABC-type iron transport system FetAB ATPase subunit
VLNIANLAIDETNQVSLNLSAGEVVCLSGLSGCGKTRLLRAIADLDEVSGEIRLNDVSKTDIQVTDWRQKIQFISSESQWWYHTVEQHFSPDLEDMQALGLSPDLLSRPVAQLSSGEKQRFALLRSLRLCPQVLLLDEPTANLDPESTLKVEQHLLKWIDQDKVMLWVTHQPDQVSRIAHRAYSWEEIGNNVSR